ncbi:MAG: hypothetical protein KKF88_11980 [Alphaproteobacteria bacterium]|nr:hypothetical protein [Alphaproteobacteria bacterium]
MQTPESLSTSLLRRLILLSAVIFAIAIGYSQTAIGWGQSPAEFSADSDETLRVASYAFAIWGLIYLGLFAHAVFQLLPQGRDRPLTESLGWPAVGALLGIGWWVVAAALDAETTTIILIFASLLVILIPLLLKARQIRAMGRKDPELWLTAWPLMLLAGWLTVAAPVNLLTVVTGNQALPDVLPPTLWAILAVVVVAVTALIVTARLRQIAFALPISWGLLAVFVAEQPRNAPLAYVALTAAVAVLVAAVILSFRLQPARNAPPADPQG